MFICVEGIDGAGKSTQARMLQQRLTQEGVDAELVSDPGTTQIGTAIRQILLHNDAPISSMAQMLLFSAARAELAAYIQERQKAGAVIICDRWILSTLVYQGVLNRISTDTILNIFNATCGVWPDFCFVLDISPEDAKARMGKPRDRYERRSLEDRHQMRNAYLELAGRPYAKITHVIDATAAPEHTHNEIYGLLVDALPKHLKTGDQHGSCSCAKVCSS